MSLTPMLLNVCGPCRAGEGGECHTPGCSFWMNRAPNIPLTAVLCRGDMIEAGAERLLAQHSRVPLPQPPFATRQAAEDARRAWAEAVLVAAGVIVPGLQDGEQ